MNGMFLSLMIEFSKRETKKFEKVLTERPGVNIIIFENDNHYHLTIKRKGVSTYEEA